MTWILGENLFLIGTPPVLFSTTCSASLQPRKNLKK